MPKVLKSYVDFEHSFESREKTGGNPVWVTLPARIYTPAKFAAGRRNVVELTDEQVRILEGSKAFQRMLRKGKNGGYIFLDKFPEHLRSPAEKLAAEKAKVAALEAELARYKTPGCATNAVDAGGKDTDHAEIE